MGTPDGLGIGAGIFVIIGEAIGDSGPAIVLSFVPAGVTFVFSALSYAGLRRPSPWWAAGWMGVTGGPPCIYLMTQLPGLTWLRFFGWMGAGLLIYIAYGYRHSRLRGERRAAGAYAQTNGRSRA